MIKASAKSNARRSVRSDAREPARLAMASRKIRDSAPEETAVVCGALRDMADALIECAIRTVMKAFERIPGGLEGLPHGLTPGAPLCAHLNLGAGCVREQLVRPYHAETSRARGPSGQVVAIA